MDKQSIAVGSSKGFPVTKRAQKQKPSNRKGAVANAKGDGNKVVRRKVNFVRDLIREVMGLAPYEKRVVGSFPSIPILHFFPHLVFEPSLRCICKFMHNIHLQSCCSSARRSVL